MISRHLAEKLIREHGWVPYTEGQWIDFGRRKSGSIITFRGHTDHKFTCSNKTASEILSIEPSRKPAGE